MYIKAHVANAKKGLQQVRDETAHLSQGFGALKQAGAMAAGMLLRDMVNSATAAISEISRLGGQISTLERSFARLVAAEQGEVSTLDELRKATKNTVADVELLKSANQALMLGLPTENLDQLFGAAIKLGHAMGIDAKRAVDSLTIGIGRQSRLVLDNLGVIVKAEAAYEWYAQQLGKTAAALSEAEKREGWMAYAIREVTEKSETLGDVTSDLTLSQERWAASITNLKTKIGEILGPLGTFADQASFVIQPLSTMVAITIPSYIAASGGLQAAIWGTVVALKAKVAAAITAMAALGPKGWVMIAGAVAAAGIAIYALTRNINDAAGSAHTFNEEMKDSLETLEDYTRAIKNLTSEHKTSLQAIDEHINALLDEREKLQETISNEDRYMRGVEATKQRIEEINAEIQKLVESRQKLVETTNEDIDALEEEREALEANIEVMKETQKFLDLISELEHDFNMIQAETSKWLEKVAGAFDEAFSAGRFEKAADIIRDFAEFYGLTFSEAEQVIQEFIEEQKKIPDSLEKTLYDEAQSVIEKFRDCSKDKLVDLQDAFKETRKQLQEKWGIGAGGYRMEDYRQYQAELAALKRQYDAARTEIQTIQAQAPRLVSTDKTAKIEVSLPERAVGPSKFVFKAPLIVVHGEATPHVINYAVTVVKQMLKNVVVETTSAGAEVKTKTIRTGTTPTTIIPEPSPPPGGAAFTPY